VHQPCVSIGGPPATRAKGRAVGVEPSGTRPLLVTSYLEARRRPTCGRGTFPLETVSRSLAACGGGLKHKDWRGERIFHTDEVAGSKPAPPTMHPVAPDCTTLLQAAISKPSAPSGRCTG
jgi:hypothetical protein